MTDIIELDSNYSTTRRVIKADPKQMAEVVKQSNKPEDKFETVLFLPEGEGREGEGGLRTQGYFKQTQDNKPLITIVTVVYNGEKFLEETILSVINQTYENVEYIIIDGGSNDGTLDIIRKYEHAIDYWVSENDSGMYDAIHKGFTLAFGNMLAWLNSDDKYFPGALHTVAGVYKKTGLTWLTGVPTRIDSSGRMLGIEHPKHYPKMLINYGFFRGDFLGFIQQESTFFSRSLYKKEPLNTSLKLAGDFHLWCNFASHSELKTIKTGLASFRVHNTQKSLDMKSYLNECNSYKKKGFLNIFKKLKFTRFFLKPWLILMDSKLIKLIKLDDFS